jgi:hypothetical protein
MFCAPGFFLGVTDGAGSRFHILRSRTRFGQYRGRWVSFSCFALPGGIEGAGSRFHVFALPDTFFAVPRASGLVYMFCALGLVFDGTKGVSARLHILCSRTLFGRYRGRWGSFSSFALPDTFLAVPRASRPVFMFCALGLFLGVTEGVGARFQVLRSRKRFWRYRGSRVPFSCFVFPDTFLAVPRASGPVFMFCAPEHIFGGTEGIGSHFHVLRSQTLFRCYRRR